MALTPIPISSDGSGPSGAIPVTLYGGDAVQTAAQTTATAIAPGTATNVQALLAELAGRIKALEDATP